MFTRRLGWLGVFVVLAAVGSGLLLAQSPQAVGTWVGVGSADNPFGNGAHVDMGDGRTLIVGGTAPDGAATNVVASFDTATNQFTVAGTLLGARTEHTATLLKDGRVLVTGGTTNSLVSTDIEIFDPSTGASALVAQMAEPRRGHVAALLQNGSVLIAGGYTTENAVLQSAFVFDPATTSIAPTPSGMNVARASASATSLIDGRVVIIGGTDGTNDLASAEIYDPSLQTFTATSTQLSVPVHGHSAVLLPHNGSVLVAGGTSNGVAQAGADLFLPAQFPDPFSWGVGQFAPTAAMGVARSSAIAGPSATEGYAVATGGGSNAVERYRFATIKTDKDDYAPGEFAIITGSGWQPNEQVRLLFQEDPAVHDDYELTVIADGAGNIRWDQWAPEQHDLNVRFYLMAEGSVSRAQTTFTDATSSLTFNISLPHTVAPSAVLNWNATVTCSGPGSGSNSCTNGGSSVGGPAVDGYTIQVVRQLTAGVCNFASKATEDTETTSGGTGSASGSFNAPATPGIYCYRAEHPSQSISGVQWSAENSTAIQITVAAANSAPTVDVNVSSVTVNEGGTATNAGTYNDTNSGDTVAISASIGTITNKTGTNTGNWSWSFGTTDGPSQSQTVTITANDNQGGITTTTFALTVNNVAPTVALSGSNSTNEGATVSYSFTTTDPGADTFSLVSQSCGSGVLSNAQFTAATGAGSFDCEFLNSGTSTVSVEVQDSDGAVGYSSIDVNVLNVAPTVDLVGPASVNEGSAAHYTFTTTDPGADTFSLLSQSCDGGVLSDPQFTAATGAGSFDCTFPNGPATKTISVRVQDSDGAASNTDSVNVSVLNVAPTATLSGSNAANEGVTVSYSFTTSDPGADTFSIVSRSCGANGTLSNALFNSSTGAGSFDCTFTDGPTSIVSVRVKDSDDAESNLSSINVTVENLAPTVIITAPVSGQLYPALASVALGSSFTDPGAGDTHTCSIIWDDGSTTPGIVGGTWPNKTCTATHDFASAGVYTIQVTVTDDEGASDTESVMVVVYDPSAGFVTGGGTIWSSAGAYVADLTLQGKANFGFVSKYQKGAKTPTGQTEFQFQAGNLNFHGDVYQWLVVSGAKAQYKGTGSLNGVDGYGFLLTATDGQLTGGGGIDKFRIKITTSGGVVVYDNNPGSDDPDSNGGQNIQTGSIVIHAK